MDSIRIHQPRPCTMHGAYLGRRIACRRAYGAHVIRARSCVRKQDCTRLRRRAPDARAPSRTKDRCPPAPTNARTHDVPTHTSRRARKPNTRTRRTAAATEVSGQSHNPSFGRHSCQCGAKAHVVPETLRVPDFSCLIFKNSRERMHTTASVLRPRRGSCAQSRPVGLLASQALM